MNKQPKLCSAEFCEAQVHGKGMCYSHYMQQRRATLPPCSVEDCQKLSRSRGLCMTHYERQLRVEAQEEENIDYDDFWEFVKKELRIGEPNARAR